MIRILFLTVLSSFFFIPARATHVVGGDLSVSYVNSDRYILKLKLYRDCYPSSNASLDLSSSVLLRKKSDNSTISSYTLPRDTMFILDYKDVECLPKDLDCRQMGIYVDTITLDPAVLADPGGYDFSFTIGNRNYSITNIVNPGSQSMMVRAEIPSPSIYPGNSSPEFRRPVLSFLCLGKSFSYDFNAVDPEGDSMVFSLYTPLNGDGTPLQWRSGYGLSYNIMDGSPDLKVDRKTGIVTVFPTRIGIYVFAIKCEEYRNGIKIGETRLENQFEVVPCSDAPPLASIDNKSGEVILSIRAEELTCFKVVGADPNEKDSVYLKIELPDPSDNMFSMGAVFSSQKLQGLDSVSGQLCWNPVCSLIRKEPYKVNFIVRDNTCPEPFWDTLRISLYVLPPLNKAPLFNSPDTNTLVYNIYGTDLFTLDFNITDPNSSQLVRLDAYSELFGPSIPPPYASFTSDTGLAASKGKLSWQTTCAHVRPQPYTARFYAIDNACPDGDTTFYQIKIFVRTPPNNAPVFSDPVMTMMDTVIIAGQLLNLPVVVHDSLDRFYKMRLEANSELFSPSLPAPVPVFNPLSDDSLISTEFTWQTECIHVRPEPYEVSFYAFDNDCPKKDTTFYTIKIHVIEPPNNAPVFTAPNTAVLNDTVIAGTTYNLLLSASDADNADSLFMDLDSEVLSASPAALFTPVKGKGSIGTGFSWTPSCDQVRDQPYVLRFYTFDNSCRRDTTFYELNLLVIPRGNQAPMPPTTFQTDTVMVGETIDYLILAFDTSASDSAFIGIISPDLFGGTLSGSQPVFESEPGLGNATAILAWKIDCEHARPEPYTVTYFMYDNACPKPDTSYHTHQIYVIKNPKYQAKFLENPPESDTLYVDELLEFTIIAGADSKEVHTTIEASSEIFNSVAPPFALFEQPGSADIATGNFKWTPACQHVRPFTPYKVIFKAYSDCPGTDTTYREMILIVKSFDDEAKELPNVFTPNGDLKNDTYTLKNVLKIYCDDTFRFLIFSRWGEKLYETTDSQFEWTAENVPQGTYYYTLESRILKKNGTITLLR